MAQAAAPLFKFCFRPGRQVAVLSCSRAIDQRWLVSSTSIMCSA